MSRPIRIANVSGWAGDRKDACLRQARADPAPDALFGDWLSELTIGWSAEARYRDRRSGRTDGDDYFVKSVLTAFDMAVDTMVDRKQKFITNAGCLSPRGCAESLQKIARQHGHGHLKFAYVSGDDVLDRFEDLNKRKPFKHFDTAKDLTSSSQRGAVCGVNAYIGAWPIVAALRNGADVVVTGRATDASAVVALAAWWHGWEEDQYSSLANSFLCGHVIECSMYVTGGNFSGFKSIVDKSTDLSFPVAEVSADGSFIVTKNPAENGIVTRQTVTAQILYEIQGNMYLCPDVQADLHDVVVEEVGQDRVRVSGAKGLAPPNTAKVAVFAVGGYQAEAFAFATGLDYKVKFQMFEKLARHWLAGQPQIKFDVLSFQHIGQPIENPRTELEATATMRIFAQAAREEDFPPNGLAALVEGLSMGTYPGFHRALDLRNTMPKMYMDYWPSRMDESELNISCSFLDGNTLHVANHREVTGPVPSASYDSPQPYEAARWGPTVLLPLGAIVMGRSGDKGGNANIGLFVRHEDEFEWLRTFLSLERLTYLLGDEAKLLTSLERVEFPGLLAVHALCRGILGGGVCNTDRLDGLAKSMVEFVRARVVELPQKFVARGTI
ncbi:hypothetical protein QBC33DRAFT_603842 [Phialemonium atrogriseum]|uniref:DUF1446-domain-containing protein n=1 Tax=Phialemonium atrogriseum TaxID=1093897 RepID=A0AAJ0BP01_9PEZI|nr:uncharacterized protein QBC33DRAFT_603842 [Phialemonium atrogriseum]KAK1761814.1 hypothetical protein QBC33DRAFT_603842 [Phialemonium atrogriseum]